LKPKRATWLLTVAFAVLGVFVTQVPIQKGTPSPLARDVTAPPRRPRVLARDVTAPPRRPRVLARDVTAPPRRPRALARDVNAAFGLGLA
jgi:hypothetical protein